MENDPTPRYGLNTPSLFFAVTRKIRIFKEPACAFRASTLLMQLKMENTETRSKKRNNEITAQYFELLDTHLSDLVNGNAGEMFELQDIAKILCISQKHLIRIIQETSGNHPCHFYVQKILEQTKILLADTDWTITDIAYRLTYDPSNFTKFFKKYEGITPSQFREMQKSEKFTITN